MRKIFTLDLISLQNVDLGGYIRMTGSSQENVSLMSEFITAKGATQDIIITEV